MLDIWGICGVCKGLEKGKCICNGSWSTRSDDSSDHLSDALWSPICSAASAGNLEILEYLCREELHGGFDGHESCAHAAARGGHLDCMKFLDNLGGSYQCENSMCAAARGGHLELLKFFHEEDKDIFQDSNSCKPAARG